MKIILQGYSGKTGNEIYRLGKERGYEIIGVDEEIPLWKYEDRHDIDALVDFSSPKGSEYAFDFAYRHHIPLIIGTTGINEEIIEQWHQKALNGHLPVYLLENYLPSMEIICSFLKELDPLFDKIDISETHHESKKDKPSGTAKMLQRSFNKDKKIPILSNRVKIYVYEHEVHLQNDYEEITITHHCLSRKAYAEGVYQIIEQLSHDKRVGIIRKRKE